MAETRISGQSYEQLTEAGKLEGKTPEQMLDAALEQFIKDNG